MKPRKIIELERRRFEILDEARVALDELGSATDPKRVAELERDHDKRMREFDLNRLEIEEAAMLEDERRAQRPPYQSGTADGADNGAAGWRANGMPEWRGETSTGWTDEKGQPVRVLAPNERMGAEHPEGIGLGDTVRAMVRGARNDAERRALSENTNTAGGYTVPTPLATWFIDRLRTQSVAIRAGALTVPMDSQTLAIARLDTDPTVGWRAESDPIAGGDPTFGRITMTARSLAGVVKVSRELMADTLNAGAMIEGAIAKVMALELDRAAIFGDGSGLSPTGVINTSGIGSVSMGTNGAAVVDYNNMIDAIYTMQAANAAYPTAAIWNPRTAASFAKLKDGMGNPLRIPEMVAKVPTLSTTAAPINETQGTATTASSVVFGDYTQLFIGLREDIRIFMLNELYAATGQLALIVHARMDVALAHNASFCRLKGIIP